MSLVRRGRVNRPTLGQAARLPALRPLESPRALVVLNREFIFCRILDGQISGLVASELATLRCVSDNEHSPAFLCVRAEAAAVQITSEWFIRHL